MIDKNESPHSGEDGMKGTRYESDSSIRRGNANSHVESYAGGWESYVWHGSK